MGLENIASRVSEAKVVGQGNFLTDGHGLLEITKLEVFDGQNGTNFKAEFKVVASTDNPNAPGGAKANPVGSSACFMCCFTGKKQTDDMQAGKMKAFLLAASGENEADVTPEGFADCVVQFCTPEGQKDAQGRVGTQPLRGVLVAYETVRRTSKAGVSLCLPTFRAAPGQTDDQIAARRAAQDGK